MWTRDQGIICPSMQVGGVRCVVGALVAVGTLAAGLAASTAILATAQPEASAGDCAELFRFAHNPVPVAKSADGQTTLATVQWGYSAAHNICYLVLDDDALDALRANSPTTTSAPPWDQAAADRCQNAYNPDRGFAGQPVPVAKTADGQTTLATIQWGYSAAHNLCFLVLDDTAVETLRTAHQQPPPPPAGAFTAIASGGDLRPHACGIRADQTAVCWGYNDDGQADAPAGAFTSISTRDTHSCGIRADQTAVCWGRNSSGQADAPAGQFTAISAGGGHSCGIKTDSTAVCWGWDEHLGGRAAAPAGTFKSISAGNSHSCGIRTDNTITCWDWNGNEQTDAPAGQFAAISAGGGHSCGIKTDSTAVCWGNNYRGKADAPAGTFKAISAGDSQSCGIKTDSTAVCWGDNRFGQADAPAGAFTAISASGNTSPHACGIRADQTVVCWGRNYFGQADAPAGTNSPPSQRAATIRAGSKPTTPPSAGAATAAGRRTRPQANSPPLPPTRCIRAGSEPTKPPSAGATTHFHFTVARW